MTTLYVAGDIGGTNSRFQLWSLSSEVCLSEKKYPSTKFKDLSAIVLAFLEEFKDIRKGQWPVSCVLGIAGPVKNNQGTVTNVAHWPVLKGDEMSKELKMEVTLINDFVAVGYGVLDLDVNDIKHVELLNDKVGPKQDAKEVIACIGAGTGLGEAFLVWTGEEYTAVGTEGGHTEFAPQTELEWRLLQYVKQRLRLSHVSVERMVSGLGIPFIYEFLCKEYPYMISSEIQRKLGLLRNEPNAHGQVIVAEAVHTGDPLAVRAIELFIDLYGAEVGNFALKTLPYGGIFVAGGIAPTAFRLMKEGDRFYKAFKDKGRMEKILAHIPIYVIRHENIGLLGAKVKAKMVTKKLSGSKSKL
jgi:glucokinase